ncbi:DUF1127 domain-containing protein [Neorhizobium galegae]|nr:hypothetical protein [Neorhizobium galegae]MCQ1572588.1 DUF1127 domain-containing protein [Neorhizobium galegae]MCQ1837060.1 DUF1127 domain-containing protein [Neorhizobium galegae]UIY30794.1 DUF1127 domain-containing protein [Neorhizobium galegae]CDZ60388.1 Hypothetical protein NGAL_HAMBI2605_09830 [Neorhizobium galegae bv. orientalis]
MRESQFKVADTLSAAVHDLCREHGVWKTAGALFLTAWRGRQERNQVSDLSNRMRRDIGFPELEDDRRNVRFSPWDIRL